MSKKILVLSATPNSGSFVEHLAQSYFQEASKLYQVKFIELSAMKFEMNLKNAYKQKQLLETCLTDFQEALTWCDHLVIFTPIWWGSIPAKFKGLIDRTFLPDFAFKYIKGKTLAIKLLKNKTARIIMTMDTPPWYYRWFQGAPALKQLKISTLEFSGFSSVKSSMYGPIVNATQEQKTNWLKKVTTLACKSK